MKRKVQKRRTKLLVRSGRRILGSIEKVGKIFAWKGKGKGDSGVTTSIKSAKRLIETDVGMSPRQFDIKVHRS